MKVALDNENRPWRWLPVGVRTDEEALRDRGKGPLGLKEDGDCSGDAEVLRDKGDEGGIDIGELDSSYSSAERWPISISSECSFKDDSTAKCWWV